MRCHTETVDYTVRASASDASDGRRSGGKACENTGVANRDGGFLGETVRMYETRDLRVSLVQYRPANTTPRHSHPYPYFSLTLQGSLIEEHGGRKGTYEAGDVLFRPAGLEHRASNPGPHRTLNVELIGGELERVAQTLLTAPADHHQGPVRQGIRRLWDELRREDDLSELAAAAIGLELVVATVRAERREEQAPGWLRRVEEILLANLAQPPSLEGISREAGVHPAHLARQFRRWHGTTVGGFVRAARLSEAKRMLRASSWTIGEIATACGFADQAHLARLFRRETGLSPSEYRHASR